MLLRRCQEIGSPDSPPSCINEPNLSADHHNGQFRPVSELWYSTGVIQLHGDPVQRPMKIAIIGTGISGLGAAYLLNGRHDITVYERAGKVGGHSRTVNVNYDGYSIPVDTGFIVYNERNYPHLTGLFRHLGVRTQESDMSFALTVKGGWLEWGARNGNSIFGQRRNLFRPAFLRLVRDVARFNTEAPRVVRENEFLTLGDLVDRLGLGPWFLPYYILPMSGAIWSCPPRQMLKFPARSFINFFQNHGLMAYSGQPQWRTVTGGSQCYVDRLTKSFTNRVRTNCAATRIFRTQYGVDVTDISGTTATYDNIVLACHGDEALALLGDANDEERKALSGFEYQENSAYLHRNASFMPRRKRCWASWVYHSNGCENAPRIGVTYWMNRLQGIDRKYPLFVTLNPDREIPQEDIFDRHTFYHPVFDQRTHQSQQKIAALQGQRHVWYCGAHLRNGFHEDGLASAVHVSERLGATPPWQISTPALEPARPHPEHTIRPLPVLEGI